MYNALQNLCLNLSLSGDYLFGLSWKKYSSSA